MGLELRRQAAGRRIKPSQLNGPSNRSGKWRSSGYAPKSYLSSGRRATAGFAAE